MSNKFEETTHKLYFWQRDSAEAERLAGQLLFHEGYVAVDPSHPLGGQDGLRDLVCQRNNKSWIAAVYFPREVGKITIGDLKDKFEHDMKGVKRHNAYGMAFFTNCKLTIGERNELIEVARNNSFELDLYHMERIAQILNKPSGYGIRLDFFDLEMSKEEQISFFVQNQKLFIEMEKNFTRQLDVIAASIDDIRSETQREDVSEQIYRLKEAASSFFAHPYASALSISIFNRDISITDLTTLADQIERLENGTSSINRRIDDMNTKLNRLMGRYSMAELAGNISSYFSLGPSIDDVIQELEIYESTLDRIIEKQSRMGRNKGGKNNR